MDDHWYKQGYRNGAAFARYEAEYDEVAAVARAGGIPSNWDLYRAEILNRYLGDRTFDFQAYAAGFARACTEVFEGL